MHIALTITEMSFLDALGYGAVPECTPRPGANPALTSPKSFRSRVLCCSRDRLLGETRCAILQGRYDATFLSSFEAWHTLSSTRFDVVVLCHTLSPGERQLWLELVRAISPLAKIVFIASGATAQAPDCDRVVLGLAGPGALLKGVEELLQPAVRLAA